MKKYRGVLTQAAHLAAIVAVCTAVMFAVYALLGRLDGKVLLGGLIGWAVAMGHFMALSLAVSRALDRAVDAQAATRLRLSIQASAGMRLLVLAVLLIVLFRTQVCDPVAALVPLLCAQVALKFIDVFSPGKGAGGA